MLLPKARGIEPFTRLTDSCQALECLTGKVRVFIDPDDLNFATVIIPGMPRDFAVPLQTTCFADLTIAEALRVMEKARREAPRDAELHQERIVRARRAIEDKNTAIGVERGLPRSYSTVEECDKMAKTLFNGVAIKPDAPLPGTVSPGSVADETAHSGVIKLGAPNRTSVVDQPPTGYLGRPSQEGELE